MTPPCPEPLPLMSITCTSAPAGATGTTTAASAPGAAKAAARGRRMPQCWHPGPPAHDSGVLSRHSSVDGQDGAVDVRRRRQGEVEGCVSDLFRVAVAAQRDATAGELGLRFF